MKEPTLGEARAFLEKSRADYALGQLADFEQIAVKMGIGEDVLHLWPDKQLEKWATRISSNGPSWLRRHWNKISAWPK